MSKFKVGDKVRIIYPKETHLDPRHKNLIVTIASIPKDGVLPSIYFKCPLDDCMYFAYIKCIIKASHTETKLGKILYR